MSFLNFNDFNAFVLNEGINDKNILKAIFVFGGPGSGKSYIISKLFSIPEHGLQTLSSSTGLKVIDSDKPFEYQLKKIGINPKDLDKLSPEEFDKLSYSKNSPRNIARKTSKLQFKNFKAGKLGLIISGTGRDISVVKHEYQTLNTH